MEENTNVNVEQAETSIKEGAETKTYTQAEVEALLQQETDRRVSQALKKQERKNAEKIKEAEKLAAMNESEKFQYQLEQREKAIAEKEKQLALAENKGAAAKILADKGLSIDLVDFVVAEDAERMNANIKTLDSAFKKSVKAEVERRLASATPKKNLPLEKQLTQKDFDRMSLADRTRLYKENPELYNNFR